MGKDLTENSGTLPVFTTGVRLPDARPLGRHEPPGPLVAAELERLVVGGAAEETLDGFDQIPHVYLLVLD